MSGDIRSVRVLSPSCAMVNELLVMSQNRLTFVPASDTACPTGVLILSTPSDVRYSSKLVRKTLSFSCRQSVDCVLPAESPLLVVSKTFQVYLNCPSHVRPGLLLVCPKSVRAVPIQCRPYFVRARISSKIMDYVEMGVVFEPISGVPHKRYQFGPA